MRSRRTMGWLLVCVTLMAGCGGEPLAPRGRTAQILAKQAAPENTSPAGALRLLEWCWNHQNSHRYCALFPQEYRFAFRPLFGNDYLISSWTFEDEGAFARHMFIGGHPTVPPATAIELALDRNFIVQADPRPGKDPRWHQYVRTGLTLRLVTAHGEMQIDGFSGFYLARGDSVGAPPCGDPPDSLHWYVERWEDEAGSSPDDEQHTLSSVKAYYR